MDTNTYNCINIDTYTDIYPILVAGRVLALTHLAAKDSFEDAHLVDVIIVTLRVTVRANTGTCTTCGDTTTTKIRCKPFQGRDAAGSVCTIISHIWRGNYTINMSRWRDDGCTLIHVDSGARGCRARGGAVRCMRSAVHGAFTLTFFFALNWLARKVQNHSRLSRADSDACAMAIRRGAGSGPQHATRTSHAAAQPQAEQPHVATAALLFMKAR